MARPKGTGNNLTERTEIKMSPDMKREVAEASAPFGGQAQFIRNAITFFLASLPSVTMNNTQHNKEAA